MWMECPALGIVAKRTREPLSSVIRCAAAAERTDDPIPRMMRIGTVVARRSDQIWCSCAHLSGADWRTLGVIRAGSYRGINPAPVLRNEDDAITLSRSGLTSGWRR